MWQYRAPVADMVYTMTQVVQAPLSWSEIPAFDGLDASTASQILEEAGRFATEQLAPLNALGDQHGCQRSPDGQVSTPPGFAQAYAAFVQAGWPALACDSECGGQGLPQLLNVALYEMACAANHAWSMYPGLLHGAYEALRAHGTPTLRERYLAPVVSGQWLSTMCLTEPQAGSDLGLVRTRIDPVDRGAPVANGDAVRVSGQKIFISGGDHDLTDNIVHMVLGRLPDAPDGTKGLSLALVPKVLPDGSANGVYCDALEHKMGIHGSATCQMRFDHAQGWLVGEPHRGLAAMFLMMNAARLHVGIQGVGHLEAARQNAWAYAHERRQMRAAQKPATQAGPASAGGSPDAASTVAADPIAWHPAMRKLLLTLQARTDATRVAAYWTGLLLDESEQHPDRHRRQQSAQFVAVLTPVVKALFTDWGHRSADEALQAFGGYGFLRDYGIEQGVRDSRIALIYEGTNEIQAIDLVQRKLLDDGGQRAAALRAVLLQEALACEALPAVAPFGQALREQLLEWEHTQAALLRAAPEDAQRPLQVADDVLMGVGFALMAWAWARIARTSLSPPGTGLSGGRSPAEWLQSATFGIQWLLPQAAVHWRRAQQVVPLPFVSGATP